MAQKFYKKIYSTREFFSALYSGMLTLPYFVKAKKSTGMTAEFNERIMLAVTEVNGCELCAYAHTKMALEQGMDNEEIQQLLEGSLEGVPAKEISAVVFAQHYADSRGKPSVQAWQQMVTVYGESVAYGILGAIRMIMIGNIYGIAASAFRSRLKGSPSGKTSIFYEFWILISILPLFPIALIGATFSRIMNRPVLQFNNPT